MREVDRVAHAHEHVEVPLERVADAEARLALRVAQDIGYERPVKVDDTTLQTDGAWYNMHLIAVGNHFVIKLNGQVVVDWFQDNPKPGNVKGSWEKGYFSIQMHHIGTLVKFKNMQVRELSPELR